MAKNNIKDEPEVLAEQNSNLAGPTDYRQIINLTKKHLIGLPVGDGTTISMSAGPFSADNSHISRPILNKHIGKYLRRLAKEGKVLIEPAKGVS